MLDYQPIQAIQVELQGVANTFLPPWLNLKSDDFLSMTRLPSFVKKNLERMFSKYFGLVKTAASNTLWSRLKQEVVTF